MLEQKDVKAHLLSVEEVLARMETSHSGLSLTEVSARVSQFGVNALPESKRKSAYLRFAMQFHNPLIYVLLVAGLVTFLLKDYVDAGVIAAVVLINAVIGFVQEGKAEDALKAVRAMMAVHAKVIRDGHHQEIDASLLVPGDIVILEPGDRVPADLRLIKVKNCHVMEAALTE